LPRTVLSVFVVNPQRIGGVEMFARELSVQLDALGWKSVLCFLDAPPDNVRRFLAVPGVSIEVLPGIDRLGWSVVRRLSRILRKHRPEIVHMHFTAPHSPTLGWRGCTRSAGIIAPITSPAWKDTSRNARRGGNAPRGVR
jgi:hypothetical protein